MRRSPRLWWLLGVGLCAFPLGCSSGTGGAANAAAPVAAPSTLPAPETGHYVVVGSSAAGLRLGDTRSGRDSVLAVTSGPVVATAASPTGRRAVIAYPRSDSIIVSMVDLHHGTVRRLRVVRPAAELSMAWAPDGARFAVGVRTTGASAGVFVSDTSGDLRDIECSAANKVEAFRGTDQLIVSDRANFYAIALTGCRTLATFPGRGKTDVRYAPDGAHVTFMRNHQTAGRPELWLAEYDGNGARVITSYDFQPAGVRWAPDGRALAFTVQSREYRNVTHVATYDVRTGDAQILREETPLGVPRDTDPCWSPDGARFAFSRSFQRTGADGQPYETRQTVVRSMSGEGTRVVSEDLVRGTANAGGRCQWVSDTHLLVRSPQGRRVVNVTSPSAYELPAWREVFAVFVR